MGPPLMPDILVAKPTPPQPKPARENTSGSGRAIVDSGLQDCAEVLKKERVTFSQFPFFELCRVIPHEGLVALSALAPGAATEWGSIRHAFMLMSGPAPSRRSRR